ncbi:MAG: PorV/PorQ family protein [Flavobacteriales bacterium]|nr:PorV/PorQ family protein [Flavobacteriales bacterium]MBK6549789.1 PorV/PorQ family protein [Flavobacteriales bacterium]MBK6883523.1 PorV/PorQ family protein [Flavobacteriales bacterium]MBK7102307.1 PorV/PorQ family protein [Flavobacteriales bacterium]MBK7113045.1 PorV/PorQ family protein [Flavobacteriales bacterium]
MSLWVACAVHAQDAPKYSNEFLAVGVGARALGMGNAYTSVVNDVTSGYWNPAGILGVQGDLQVGLMHSEYFAGIAKYDYIGLAKPIDSASTIGFTFIRFGIDNIPNTIDLIDPSGNIDYDRITSFSSADHAFIITYARKMKVPGLRIGGNAKVIYRRVGSFGKAWGFGLDGGVQYDRDQWRFSAVARDVTSTFNAWSYTLDERTIEVFTQTENEIPVNSVEVTLPRLNLGVARQFKFGSKFDLIAAVDLENTFDGQRNTLIKSELVSTDPRVGLELGYAGVVYIRTGVSNMQYITDISDNKQLSVQPNIGLGLKIKSVSLDYALTDIGDNSVALYSNIFSLKFDLFKRPGS